jgi:hypothetical protein
MLPVLPVVPLRVGLGVGLLLLVLVGGKLHLPQLVGERLTAPMVLPPMYVFVLVAWRGFDAF